MQPNEPERGSLPGLTNHSSDQYGAGLYCVRKQPLSAPRQSRLNPPRGPVLDYHVCSAHNRCIMEIRQDWLGRGEKIGRGPRALKPSRHPCVVLKTVIIPVISSRLVGVQSIGDNHLLTQTQRVMAEVTWPSNNSPIQICVVSRLKLAQKCMTDSFLIQLYGVCLCWGVKNLVSMHDTGWPLHLVCLECLGIWLKPHYSHTVERRNQLSRCHVAFSFSLKEPAEPLIRSLLAHVLSFSASFVFPCAPARTGGAFCRSSAGDAGRP